MENQELIKQVTEKAEKWLTPAYDAETQAEVKRMLEKMCIRDSSYTCYPFGEYHLLKCGICVIPRFAKSLRYGCRPACGDVEVQSIPVIFSTPDAASLTASTHSAEFIRGIKALLYSNSISIPFIWHMCQQISFILPSIMS